MNKTVSESVRAEGNLNDCLIQFSDFIQKGGPEKENGLPKGTAAT